MTAPTLWFGIIAFLWTGFFVLEGFDFGVGMLLRIVGRDDRERRAVIHTIGPVWDGNEVWLIVAGGATFAAFPEWYATLFSGFYLPLLLILVALIVRNLAFEYRAKKDDDVWHRNWDLGLVIGSFVPRSSGASRSPTSSPAYRSARTRSSPATCSRCSTRSGCSVAS